MQPPSNSHMLYAVAQNAALLLVAFPCLEAAAATERGSLAASAAYAAAAGGAAGAAAEAGGGASGGTMVVAYTVMERLVMCGELAASLWHWARMLVPFRLEEGWWGREDAAWVSSLWSLEFSPLSFAFTR